MNMNSKDKMIHGAPSASHDSDVDGQDQRFIQIAAGGTGKVALLQQELDSLIRDIATIFNLYMDTDSAELSAIPAERKFLMNDFAAARYFAELKENPDRFPHGDLTPFVDLFQQALGRVKDISTGLMTNRILGRPLLDYYATRLFPELAAFFLQPARQLHAFACDPCGRKFHGHIQERIRLTVTFVASICGGTGSSVGQLLPHLVDFLLMHQGGFTRYHLVADLFLPGVLESKSIAPDILRANAHAVLLDNLRAIKEKLPAYKLGQVTLAHTLPLRHLYLFDNINALGEVLETREQVTQMRNATWELRSLGATGEEYRSRITDIPLDIPAFYSAAGAAILEHDVDHSLTLLGYRTGIAVVARMLESLPEAKSLKLATQHWDELKRRGSQLCSLPTLKSKVDGSPLGLDLAQVGDHQRQRVGRAMHYAIRRGYTDWQEAFGNLMTQETAVRKQALVAQVVSLLNQVGGFTLALGFMQRLRQHWQRELQILEPSMAGTSQQLTRQQAQLQEEPRKLWRRWKWNPRGAYVQGYQQYVDGQLDLIRQQAQKQIATNLLKVMDEIENQVLQFQSALGELVERLEADCQRYQHTYRLNQSVAVHSVVCEQDIENWYVQRAAQACEEVGNQIRIVWFEDEAAFGIQRQTKTEADRNRLPILSPAGIARHLDHAQSPWEHVREYSVEAILQARGTSPVEIYAQLERMSAPWVSLNDVKLIPAHKRLMILASCTDEFFHDLPQYTGLSVIATGDPYRMSLLTTWHGIDPLEHLTKSQDHKRAYEQAVAEGRSLHLFPELDPAVQTHSQLRFTDLEDDVPF